jgi:hypothetical protein
MRRAIGACVLRSPPGNVGEGACLLELLAAAAGGLLPQLLQLEGGQVQAQRLQLLRRRNARQLLLGCCGGRQQRQALLGLRKRSMQAKLGECTQRLSDWRCSNQREVHLPQAHCLTHTTTSPHLSLLPLPLTTPTCFTALSRMLEADRKTSRPAASTSCSAASSGRPCR